MEISPVRPLSRAPMTAPQAIEQGLTREQLRGPRFSSVLRGVYLPASVTPDLALRCDAALQLYPAAALSHETAVQLWALPMPVSTTRVTSQLHLTVRPGFTKPKRAGICGHIRTLADDEVRCLAGRVLTAVPRTFVDLAESWIVEDLIVIGDAMLQHVAIDELTEALNRAGRRRGVVAGRHAAAHLDKRSGSPMESLLRARLIMAGLPTPEVNVDLYDDFGRWMARPDLFYRQAMLAIEYEGEHHRTRRQFDRDTLRDRNYAELGIRVVRVTARDVLVVPQSLTDAIARLLGLKD